MPDHDPRPDGPGNPQGGPDHGKTVTVVINTVPHEWSKKAISFGDLIEIEYPGQPLQEGDVVRIDYSRGPEGHSRGILKAGDAVPVKDGMVFNVHRTNRS